MANAMPANGYRINFRSNLLFIIELIIRYIVIINNWIMNPWYNHVNSNEVINSDLYIFLSMKYNVRINDMIANGIALGRRNLYIKFTDEIA